MKATFYKLITSIFFISAISLSMNCNKNKNCTAIDRDCICTQQIDPVCGCNNKTYSNSCEAECDGITTYTKGECK